MKKYGPSSRLSLIVAMMPLLEKRKADSSSWRRKRKQYIVPLTDRGQRRTVGVNCLQIVGSWPFLFVREDVKTQAAEKPEIPNIKTEKSIKPKGEALWRTLTRAQLKDLTA